MKVTMVFFKDSVSVPTTKINADMSLSAGKYEGLTMESAKEGVMIKIGTKATLVPFSNIKNAVVELDAK